MNPPKRVQRKRTKGWRMPEGAVNVCRPCDWGNPYRVGDLVTIEAPSTSDPARSYRCTNYVYAPTITPEIAVLLFRIWVSGRLADQIRDELRDKDLVCWCRLDQPCHADVLLQIANGGA